MTQTVEEKRARRKARRTVRKERRAQGASQLTTTTEKETKASQKAKTPPTPVSYEELGTALIKELGLELLNEDETITTEDRTSTLAFYTLSLPFIQKEFQKGQAEFTAVGDFIKDLLNRRGIAPRMTGKAALFAPELLGIQFQTGEIR